MFVWNLLVFILDILYLNLNTLIIKIEGFAGKVPKQTDSPNK